MNKKITIVLVVVLCGIGIFLYRSAESPINQSLDSHSGGYLDATFVIEGEQITLVDGYYEKEIVPDSASKTVVQYFGNEAFGDISGDGVSDVVFLVTRSDGGTGTMYYAVAAIREADTYMGTNAIFLGDRIAPQSTEILDGDGIINFATRNADDSFADQPTIGTTIRVHYEKGILTSIK